MLILLLVNLKTVKTFFVLFMKLKIIQINTHAEFQSRQTDGRDMVSCLSRVYDQVEDKIQSHQMLNKECSELDPGLISEYILKTYSLYNNPKNSVLLLTTFQLGFLTVETVLFFFFFKRY